MDKELEERLAKIELEVQAMKQRVIALQRIALELTKEASDANRGAD